MEITVIKISVYDTIIIKIWLKVFGVYIFKIYERRNYEVFYQIKNYTS